MKAKTIRAHLALTALPALVAMAIAGSAGAEDYKWPDNIPPEAKAMIGSASQAREPPSLARPTNHMSGISRYTSPISGSSSARVRTVLGPSIRRSATAYSHAPITAPDALVTRSINDV